MEWKALLILFIILQPAAVAADNHSNESDEGLISHVPEIQVDSEREVNATGNANTARTDFIWIVILGLCTAGIVVYSFEIDPVYVAVVTAILGIVYGVMRFGLLPV